MRFSSVVIASCRRNSNTFLSLLTFPFCSLPSPYFSIQLIISSYVSNFSSANYPLSLSLFFSTLLSPYTLSLWASHSLFSSFSPYFFVLFFWPSLCSSLLCSVMLPPYLFPPRLISPSGVGRASPPSSPCRAAVSERGSPPEHRDA